MRGCNTEYIERLTENIKKKGHKNSERALEIFKLAPEDPGKAKEDLQNVFGYTAEEARNIVNQLQWREHAADSSTVNVQKAEAAIKGTGTGGR